MPEWRRWSVRCTVWFRRLRNSLLAISAIMIVIFFVPYTASGFAACGKLFATLFGVPYMPAMIVSAIIIVAYTSLGGFLAASTTDFVQSIVMTLAIIVVFGFGITKVGSFEAVKWKNKVRRLGVDGAN